MSTAYDEGLRSITEVADATLGQYTPVSNLIGSPKPLSAPTGVTVTPQGTTGSTTYGYRVSAVSALGETLASAEVTTTTGNATLSGTNKNHVAWTAVSGAVAYNVYGRTAGAEQFLSQVTTNSYDDTGADTPSGALPTVNLSGTNAGKQFRFVKYGSGTGKVTLATGASQEIPVGVLQNKPQYDGDAATVGIRGKSIVQLGETFAGGEPVKVGSDGTARIGVLGTDFIVGVCAVGGGKGQLGSVNLMPIGK